MTIVSDGASDTGGRRQPGGLRVIQSFVNTLDVEDGQNSLEGPRSLAEWLVAKRMIGQRSDLSAADLGRARELREALRALLLANAGEPLDPTAPETLSRIGRTALLQTRFDDAGAAHLEPAAPGIDAALARLLAHVVTAMTDGSWVRLKACRSDTCRWAFFDASKNRSGAWCSMAVCGNRSKVRSYQRRRRGAAERVASSE